MEIFVPFRVHTAQDADHWIRKHKQFLQLSNENRAIFDFWLAAQLTKPEDEKLFNICRVLYDRNIEFVLEAYVEICIRKRGYHKTKSNRSHPYNGVNSRTKSTQLGAAFFEFELTGSSFGRGNTATQGVPFFGSVETVPSFFDKGKIPSSFGSAESVPSFGSTETGPSFSTGKITRSFGSAQTTPSFGSVQTTRSFGSEQTTPTFGSVQTTRSFGSERTTPSFGGAARINEFGLNSNKVEPNITTPTSAKTIKVEPNTIIPVKSDDKSKEKK